MSTAALPTKPVVIYPEDDGEPMSDNTVQFRWIMTIQGGLDALFRDNANVLVAGDLLWYPVEGDNTIRQAPDIMTAFERPKGDRGSYRQWEEGGIAPQVVFEVWSPLNRPGKMEEKFQFYDRYGVEEYYLYYPERNHLEGWIRSEGRLREIPTMSGWVSPRLGIRFELTTETLHICGPDGVRFLTYVELAQQRDEERARAERLAAKLRALGIDPDA
jgi:Uma2 family endonuclease